VTQSLDSLLFTYQTLRHIGEWILIAGLVGELLTIAFVDWLLDVPPHALDARRKLVTELLCTGLIVVGVGIESFAGSRGDDVIGRMRASRSLNKVQREAIQKKLQPFGPHKVYLYLINDIDPEIAGIAVDISKACALPGWFSGFDSLPPNPPSWMRVPTRGIVVLISPAAPDKTVLLVGKTLVSMLEEYGMEAELSQTFVGPYPPISDRINVIVYTK
jgi:hypothetical protein